MENPTTQVIGPPGKTVTVRGGLIRTRSLPASDGLLGVRIQFFIGIKAENPIVLRLLACEIFLAGKARKRMHNHPRALFRRNLLGAVSRARVYYNNLIDQR